MRGRPRRPNHRVLCHRPGPTWRSTRRVYEGLSVDRSFDLLVATAFDGSSTPPQQPSFAALRLPQRAVGRAGGQPGGRVRPFPQASGSDREKEERKETTALPRGGDRTAMFFEAIERDDPRMKDIDKGDFRPRAGTTRASSAGSRTRRAVTGADWRTRIDARTGLPSTHYPAVATTSRPARPCDGIAVRRGSASRPNLERLEDLGQPAPPALARAPVGLADLGETNHT